MVFEPDDRSNPEADAKELYRIDTGLIKRWVTDHGEA